MHPDAQAAGPQKREASVATYVKKWGIEVEAKAVRPGIWRRREGGYLARVQATHPQTGKPLSRIKTLPTVADAVAWQVDARREIAALGEEKPRRQIRFTAYAVSLIEVKQARGEINSQATLDVWASAIERHIHPVFGEMFIDKIRSCDVRDWFNGLAKRVEAGEFKPRTVNHLLALVKLILSGAVADELIDKNPAETIRALPTTRQRVYTREQPNSLTPAELPALWTFLESKKPHWFALIALGNCYGLRPSSLRPLRWRGPCPDAVWEPAGPWAPPLAATEAELAAIQALPEPERPVPMLLIRRSHTRGEIVMDSTKNAEDLELPLDPAILELLRWHVAHYAREGSDLLFPGRDGSYLSRNAIAYWFAVCEARLRHVEGCPEAIHRPPKKGEPKRVPVCAGCTAFGKHITPRAMRRSFYNLTARTAAQDAMIRSISGHRTPGMADRYRSQSLPGQRALMGEVVSLAKVRSERSAHSETGSERPDGAERCAGAQRRGKR